MLPYFQFGMNCQCFAAARLTWSAYVDGTKLENSSVWKDLIIVASTCIRYRYVQFGCYINQTLDGKLCFRDDKNATFV